MKRRILTVVEQEPIRLPNGEETEHRWLTQVKEIDIRHPMPYGLVSLRDLERGLGK